MKRKILVVLAVLVLSCFYVAGMFSFLTGEPPIDTGERIRRE
jgi:hypothetical protein